MDNKNIESHSGHKTGEEIYHTQELTRKKNETEYNVYRYKKKLDKDSNIMFILLAIILILVILVMIF